MLPNNATFSREEILSIFTGSKSCFNFETYSFATGVSTDTRDIADGNIFVALKGETSDGHTRINEAFSKGAAACIVSNDWYRSNQSQILSDQPIIAVDDTLKALQELAAFHRDRFEIPIVAVAGANGKTTTKEMIAYILSQHYKILKTAENYNNQIGVPLMMLQLNESHQAAVFEIGTNEPGEIYTLSKLVAPTLGVITNIGKEHLEKLIDLDGVESEETSLFAFLLKKGGISLINCDDTRLKKYAALIEPNFTFGTDSDSDLSAEISLSNELVPNVKMKYDDDEIDVTLKTFGYTSALNAVAASAVALNFGFSLEELKPILESYKSTGSFNHSYGRMSVENLGSTMLINDCYNANPNSMTAAIESLKFLHDFDSKIIVLGDMFELGKSAPDAHEEIVSLASGTANIVLLCGSNFGNAVKIIRRDNVFWFNSQDVLCRQLKNYLFKGKTAILVKGSRGMKMENIVNFIKSEIEGKEEK